MRFLKLFLFKRQQFLSTFINAFSIGFLMVGHDYPVITHITSSHKNKVTLIFTFETLRR